MKVSLNTIEELAGIELPPTDELVDIINRNLGAVEEVIELGEKYKDARIVRVVECKKHPNADKLSLCQVDVGDKELVQIVCGANNVHADMWAVWLPPKSIVPSTFDDDEPFVLGARELRGEMSHGMLASAKELAIGSDHDGIVELTDTDLSADKRLEAGASFAEVFDLNDTILDIENKMFTHRPDLFGQLGVAREIFAILQPVGDTAKHTNVRFSEPDWYWSMAEFTKAESLKLDVFNEAPDKSARFMAVAMDNVKVGPSPMWLQTTLVRWGSKSINNVVDLTNYIMLLSAQPTHAYDYDKLQGQKIGVRMARNDEKATLLNDKTYTLTTDDIVIADGERVVGLAGVMGGGDSEVSTETTRIVLEVATFDMYTVRKTSMRYGLFTDALTRFNKGQSPFQNERVMSRLMSLMSEHAGAKQASAVADQASDEFKNLHTTQSFAHEMQISEQFINERLGLELTGPQIGNLLRLVNFAAYSPNDDKTLSITAPYWRTDIVDPEDIVEEVGRLYGFDKLPRELPRRSTAPVAKNPSRQTKQQLRKVLADSGANEVLTYSFVHENILRQAGQDPDKAYKLSNALSPDLQYYRLSLVPSLLSHVHKNSKSGHDTFTLFEIGKAHHIDAVDSDGLPIELGRVAGVYADKQTRGGGPYFVARQYVEQIISHYNLDVRYQPLSEFDFKNYDALKQLAAPFDPKRSAMLWVGDKFIGVVGEFRRTVMRNFKLPEQSAGFELFLSIFESTQVSPTYRPLSRFPSVTQDVTLRASADVAYQDLAQAVITAADTAADNRLVEVKPVSIYQPADDSDQLTTTFRVTLTDYEQTLTEDAASHVVRAIVDAAADQYGAVQA